MSAALREHQEIRDIEEIAFEDRLTLLLEREKADRANRRFQRLLGQARLHLQATLEDLNFTEARGMDRTLIPRLGDCEWIRRGQSVLLVGATGSGKSYLACALGDQACRHGLSVRYFRLSRLLDGVRLARGDGSRTRLLQRLARAHLLILDDWGVAPLDDVARHDLLEVLDDRYGRRGTLLTSQIPIDHWHAIVGDPTFGDAILDRLLHNAHRLPLKGGSMHRVYDTMKRDTAGPNEPE